MNPAPVSTARFSGALQQSSTATTLLSMAQLAQISGIDANALASLIDFGVLTGTLSEDESGKFEIGFVMTLQRAQRLREDLALDEHAFALAVMLLEHVSSLEEGLRLVRLEAQTGASRMSSVPS